MFSWWIHRHLLYFWSHRWTYMLHRMLCMFSKIRKRRLENRKWKDNFTKRLCNRALRDVEFPALRTYLIQLPDFTGKWRLTCSKDLPRESELDLEPRSPNSQPRALHTTFIKKLRCSGLERPSRLGPLKDSSKDGSPWHNTGSTAQRSRPITFISERNVLEADAWCLY